MASVVDYEQTCDKIIKVLIKLDKEIQSYDRLSREFGLRMYGIDKILTGVEKDFGGDCLYWLLTTLYNRLGRPLPTDYIMAGRLLERNCSVPGVRSVFRVYSWEVVLFM